MGAPVAVVGRAAPIQEETPDEASTDQEASAEEQPSEGAAGSGTHWEQTGPGHAR